MCTLRPVVQPKVCLAMEEAESMRAELHDEVWAVLSDAEYSCGGMPGWWKVGFLEMTNTSEQCLDGLVRSQASGPLRACANPPDGISCSSTFFSVGGLEYSKVCGRITAYQYAYTLSFIQNRGLRGLPRWSKPDSWSCWTEGSYLVIRSRTC